MLLKFLVPLGLLAAGAPALSQGNDAALTAELETLAAQGNAEAAYHAGVAYQMGINGVRKDPKKAFEYFKQSAEGGDPLGAYKLGTFYDGQGEGVVEDDAELALAHKLVAAKAGYSLAQHDVAKFFYQKDEPAQAIEWLAAAARQGYKESLQALASLYAGEGKVAKDNGKSYAYLLLMQGGSVDKAPEKARQILQELRAKLTPAEKADADAIVAGWKFKPTILTMHALAGQRSAKALLDRAKVPAQTKEVQGPKES
jgi:TPR repeat protein